LTRDKSGNQTPGMPTKVDDKLDDLEAGDPFLPGDADAPSALEVIPVHDHMHHQVQRDRDPRYRGMADKLRIAEKCSRAMVVAMKEC